MTTETKGGAARPRPTKVSAFRLPAETVDLIAALAESFRPSPEMTITKTSVIERAIRELAERQLPPPSRS